MMHGFLFTVVVVTTLFQTYGSMQVPMIEGGDELISNVQLENQIKDMERNLSDLWSYVFELRGSLVRHLKFLREHQVALESNVHMMEHQVHDRSYSSHSDDHHHSGESHGSSGDNHAHSPDDHHHSGEQHSHTDDGHSHGDGGHSHGGSGHSHGDSGHSHGDSGHSHGDGGHSHGDGGHSHGEGDHSHGDDDHHHHSGESHTHGSNTGDHTHSGEYHHSFSTHSHSDHEDHGHQHKDSGEPEDITQSVQKPQIEPLIVPTRDRQNIHPTPRTPMSEFEFFENDLSHHHHHHHHSSKNKTVVPPKLSESNLYHIAICDMKPNRALPEDKQQNVFGQVSFWQKKTGSPLNIHVKVQGFEMEGHDHHGAHQQVQTEEDHSTVPPMVHRHGFHVHESSDLSNGCQLTGPHYNPKGVKHGNPAGFSRHVGDLGNIECDDHGMTNILFSDNIASMVGPYSIIGKSLVIHANTDDYGLGNNTESTKTGNAGSRIACCLIEKVERLPVRTYKSLKLAKQHKNW